MRLSTRSILLGAVVGFSLACASTPQTVRFSEVPPAPASDVLANRYHPPIVTLEQLQKLDRAPVELRSRKYAGAGVTGAQEAEVYLPTLHADLKVKVKPVPRRLDGPNNSPRKELAAYRIQLLFLDPVDYVVPTTAPRCLTPEEWGEPDGETKPTVEGTSCMLVTVSLWLRNVTLPDPLYDKDRFLSDPRYAYHLANFNVLTHLVDHRDNRMGNFLVSSNDEDRRVFAIDNGTTFGAWLFNWFYPPNSSWRNIRVPALPRTTVDRLRALEREALDYLAVVSQLEADEAGILRVVIPTESIDPTEGARRRGTTVQFGLTQEEIEDVWGRIRVVLEKVDDGRLTLF